MKELTHTRLDQLVGGDCLTAAAIGAAVGAAFGSLGGALVGAGFAYGYCIASS